MRDDGGGAYASVAHVAHEPRAPEALAKEELAVRVACRARKHSLRPRGRCSRRAALRPKVAAALGRDGEAAR